MKSAKELLLPALGVVLVLAVSAATAVDAPRADLVQAAGACVPTNVDDPVIHRVGGVRNSGTKPVYIICGMQADWVGSLESDSANQVGIELRNTSTETVTATCTLYAGYTTSSTSVSQGTFTQNHDIPAGGEWEFRFLASSLLGSNYQWATPNFVCKLDPKVEATYVFRLFNENIGG